MSNSNVVRVIVMVVVLVIILAVGVWYYMNSRGEGGSIIGNIIKGDDIYLKGEFDLQTLKSENLPIILAFTSKTSDESKRTDEVLKQVAKETSGKSVIKLIDVDEYKELTEHYNIVRYPTQVLIKSDGTAYYAGAQEGFLMLGDDNNQLYMTQHIGEMTKEQALSLLNEMGMNK